MRRLAFLFTILPISLAGEQSVSRVAFTRSEHAIRAFSPWGQITLQAVRRQLEIRHANGKLGYGDLTVVYDLPSSHYLWDLYRRRVPATLPVSLPHWSLGSGRSMLHRTSSSILGCRRAFIFTSIRSGPVAWMLPRARRSTRIQSTPAIFEARGYDFEDKAVPVFHAIGMDFACTRLGDPNFSQGCGFGIKRFCQYRQ